MVFCDAVVVIEAQSQRKRRRSERQAVLRKECFLLGVRVTVKDELSAAARQVKGQETGQGIRTGRIVEARIGDAELKAFGHKRKRELHAELDVVSSLHVREIGFDAGVVQ